MATVSGPTQSALDVAGIVSQLMALERKPLSKLAQKEADIQAKVSAFGSIKGALIEFQGTFSGLNTLATYQTFKATSSDEAQVKVTAGVDAPIGSHSVRVTGLASAHAVASTNFTSPSSIVGTGALTFQKGTASGGGFTPNAAYATKSVTIGNAQNTLAGIRDAVNSAGVGITASIVNDGTGYRLVFASTDGAANGLKIAVGDSDLNDTNAAGLSALAYDPAASPGSGKNMIEMRGAQDAVVIIDGITVTNPSNVITSAIDGITFTANAISASAATVKVEVDTASIKTGIEAFVKSYNDVVRQLKELSSYDATTKKAGLLNGDSTVRALQSELRTMITGKVASVGAVQSLNDIGITLDKTGVLVVDKAKLQSQLDRDRNAVAQLFAKSGQPTDSRVSFMKSMNNTRPGIFEITVSQAPTQGTLVANQVAQLMVTTSVNDTLALVIDGVPVSVTLPAKTYQSVAELASDLQSRIAGNAALSAAGASVTVTSSGDLLTITSMRYGTASSVTVGGSAAPSLFGNSPIVTPGTNIAGTIGGAAAIGNGQVLLGTAKANGLEIKINTSVTGSVGTIKYFEGITAKLDERISALTGNSGSLKARTDGYAASIKAVDKLMTEYEDRLDKLEQRYRRQYSALDATLAKMSNTSAYLQQQLATITSNKASS